MSQGHLFLSHRGLRWTDTLPTPPAGTSALIESVGRTAVPRCVPVIGWGGETDAGWRDWHKEAQERKVCLQCVLSAEPVRAAPQGGFKADDIGWGGGNGCGFERLAQGSSGAEYPRVAPQCGCTAEPVRFVPRWLYGRCHRETDAG
ncbi:Hypp6261 [Branchiostoma lanceolatum]|uniref:Hypp6261 protein n=1 Tax=Branchiostoma lanceolatum TaxID=7740 RepID=A0A8J9YSF2_BRALA|nr:Hypp6261 [Branchiostoma lanceolatum]